MAPAKTKLKHGPLSRLPYWRHAWLISVVFVLVVGIPMHLGASIPVPFLIQIVSVAVAASLGGLRSGLLAGAISSTLQVSVYVVGIGPSELIGSTFNIVSAVLITIGLGAYLGALRDNGNQLFLELNRHKKELAEANTALSERVDKRSQELELLKDRLLLSQRRLRNVTKRWVDSQESERRKLARDLHDDIGQCLTALRINLETHKKLFADNEEATKFIETSYGLVDEVISSVRQLSLNLRPSLLDDLGLVAALREFVLKQMNLSHIDCKLEVEGSDHFIDPTHSIAAYRIVQEIVSNILRHSGAEQVLVRIEISPSDLLIEFRDNGIGFDAAADEDNTEYYGLASMRERAALVGGDVIVSSTEGEGTIVSLTMPLRDDESDESDAAA